MNIRFSPLYRVGSVKGVHFYDEKLHFSGSKKDKNLIHILYE